MTESLLVQKIIDNIAKKEKELKNELTDIKQKEDLLDYIKGMIDITAENTLNFPYYNDEDESEGKDNFEAMLRYTLKYENLINDFKMQIKNLYFLDKVGYSNTKQYETAKNSLEEYRTKIISAYNNFITNNTIKKALEEKETIIKKLEKTESILEKNILETEDIDSFYDGLKYTDINDSDKTSILYVIFENNLQAILRTFQELKDVEQEKKDKKDSKKDDKYENRFIIYQEEV